jgi:hypothetical protein
VETRYVYRFNDRPVRWAPWIIRRVKSAIRNASPTDFLPLIAALYLRPNVRPELVRRSPGPANAPEILEDKIELSLKVL